MSERQNREFWLDPPCVLLKKNKDNGQDFVQIKADVDSFWDGDFCWGKALINEPKSEVVLQRIYRKSNNPDDIRSPLKRWKAVLYQGFGAIPLQLEPWAIPLSDQPKARLSKNRRNLENKRIRLEFRRIGP